MRQLADRSPTGNASGFKGEGSIGVHRLSSPGLCCDNAVIFAMLELPMEMARTLAWAGGGSEGLEQELAWAAQHGRALEVRMLLAANPKSAALAGPIGKDLVRMAVDKGDVDLARALCALGVDISSEFIHDMNLEKALSLSCRECSDYLMANGWALGDRERGVLMAFAKDAREREGASSNTKAPEKEHGDQPEASAG